MSEFILILIAVIILFSVFRRYIFFLIMKAVSKRLFDQVRKQNRNMYDQKPEGSVTIDTSGSRKKKRNDSNEGEYVNYEEVK